MAQNDGFLATIGHGTLSALLWTLSRMPFRVLYFLSECHVLCDASRCTLPA